MMRSEFIERTGFEPTADEYAEIEQEYMGCDIDKDLFCKQWKKQGGIERMMRRRARRIEELEDSLKKAESDYDRMDAQYCTTINELRNEKKAMQDKYDNDMKGRFDYESLLEEENKRLERQVEELEDKIDTLKKAFKILTGKEEQE